MLEGYLRKRALAVAAAGTLIMTAGAANAALVTFTDFGGATGASAPAGESLITDFSSTAGLTSNSVTPVSDLLVIGSISSVNAAPALSSTTAVTGQYLSVEGTQDAELSLTKLYHHLSVYVGSLDDYNTITFYTGSTIVGSPLTGLDLQNLTTAMVGGNQSSGDSNGMFTFNFATGVDGIKFESGQNAFEVASVSGAVPEISTWAMMLSGFAFLGYAGYWRNSKRTSQAVTA